MTEKKILDAVEVDWSSRDVWNVDSREAVASFTGAAYLSAAFADPNNNAMTFNLHVPCIGSAFIEWLSELPATVSLATETLEAAALSRIDPTDIEREQRELQAPYVQALLDNVLARLQDALLSYECLMSEANAMGLSYKELSALSRIAEHIDGAVDYVNSEIDAREQS